MSSLQPLQPITRIGTVTTQGDETINTDWVRETLTLEAQNIDGDGIKIGVISDSYNRHSGETQDINSGDLPGLANPNGYTTPVNILADNTNPYGKDEGRAMLQIIHDIAPGAELMFHSAVSKTEMASAVRKLEQAGADIIVDDLGFVNQSFFQDGIIAQAVDEVAEKGVVYISAAGNDGERSYEDSFRPLDNAAGFSFDNQNYIVHDFNNNGDAFNSFTLPQGKTLTLTFQWDDAFDNAVHNLDIFVVRNNDLTNLDIVAHSTDDNIGNNPLETISYTNNTDTNNFSILIAQRDNIATHPENIKYISFSSKADNFEYGHDSSTIFGHPNAAGAIAVGAVRYHTPNEIKSSSSMGGTPILLDENGNPLNTPEVRLKPDIVAPDNVSTTVEGFETFSGTSAAAPHVAGLTALMLQANGGEGSLTPDEVRSLLQQTANDIEISGIDYHSGAGIVQADAALQLFVSPQNTDNRIVRENRDNRNNNTATEAEDTLTGGQADDTLFGYGSDDNLQGEGGNDILFGNQGDDQLEGNEGNDKLHGGQNNDNLKGNEGNDILSGEKGEDTLLGGLGDDILYGGKGQDVLLGRQGDDILYGDLGDDILIGGSGGDRFMLSATTGVDQITDFDLSEDLIGLMDGLTASQVQWQFNQMGETVISLESNNQPLAILDGLHSLTQQHFITV
ncbi:MAG: S8 family serine peptidase [Microcoleaceae cyanobacterium]